jgi:hypothetical protein
LCGLFSSLFYLSLTHSTSFSSQETLVLLPLADDQELMMLMLVIQAMERCKEREKKAFRLFNSFFLSSDATFCL